MNAICVTWLIGSQQQLDTVDFSSLAKFKRSIDAVKTTVFTGTVTLSL